MDNIIPKEENTSVSTTDLDTIKSVYYWLNAKPDTNIKVFQETRKVTFNDIITLNQQIQDKLKNHNLFTSVTTINIIFKGGKIKSYGAWNEFQRTSWEIPEVTESISISWDINIQLPNYQLPQRHTMKVRLGSSIKPGEFFQMMTTSDDDVDIIENTSFLVCKVDFVNAVISNELIAIVENWHSCLKKTDTIAWFQKYAENHKHSIARISHYLIPFTGLMLLYVAFKYHLSKYETIIFDKVTYTDMYIWILFIFIVYFLFNFIGSTLGERIYSLVNKFDSPMIFDVTRGDKNSQDEINKKNTGLSKQLNIQFWLSVIGSLLSIILTKLIERFWN